MVKNVLGVNHQGLTEWIFQRVTALIMAIYVIGLVAFIMGHSPLDYNQWHDLFSNVGIKTATMIVVLSILYHAWIGMWTIFTDYVKPLVLNMFLQGAVLLSLVACFFYALLIVWGV
ncbi:MAG: succinate dehydrogenase, hydrophobic membrane anchor protein [Gammaproteobacteria bacterium]|nr:succinate dehydrogenase, hydrophobic membrane anchor protein [Gammaproteobacteria bacterium]